ncbi:5-formyltetrahydrofolate cyclo-ligase [Nocardia sp. CC227C]|uniref:5-formyltetrahydrofolate cyclo-ligase n=1 Tax=Nocardia sp. CC227C TaxID=3044562 RepID=UPI00278C471F|nr:5-formyltetrahydrofolate cyclo-ligase [Nocardia sp. CC227C]
MTTGEWDKQAWRAELLARRAAVSAEERMAEAAALAAGVTALHADGWVCAYVPVGSEPGSLALLDALRAGGARVLLPVTGPPGPLAWAEYLGGDRLRRARYGLLEPDGPTIPDALDLAELILIPALAVDRRGVRLGRGAGYYDRTLHAARPDARLIAVVRDDELVDHLPEEPHDHRMGWVLTPHHGLRRLEADTHD